ncbi:MAG TPA: hypothetical protein VM029_04700 [Opitutaceae bacterium]|nr:hypothetical protein [Opitutaceae bacterium]
MKLSSWLLSASLLANAILAGVFVFRGGTPSSVGSSSGRVTSTGAASAATPTAGVQKGSSASAANASTWAQINTNDLPTLVARLREGGFPPTVVSRVISRLVTERYDAQRLELEKASLEAPLATNNPSPYQDPKIGPEFRKLQREQMETIRQLLGGTMNDVFADTPENKALLRHQIGDIPADKIDRLYAAAMDFSEKVSQVVAGTNNGRTMLNADREKMVAIEQAFQAEMAKFLTPAEAADFMMHGGMMGSQLRNMLSPFQPSEQEYKALFPYFAAFQQQFPSQASQLSPEQEILRRTAEEQMMAQVRGTVGADRAADFKQAITPEYQQLNRLVARLDLPISAATQVVTVQQDIQQRATALRTDGALSAAERTTRMSHLAQEASNRISAAIGARGLEAYKQYGGQWLVSMVPPTPAPKK